MFYCIMQRINKKINGNEQSNERMKIAPQNIFDILVNYVKITLNN